jgi:hypothetical protein
MTELAARTWIRSRHGPDTRTYWQQVDRSLLNMDSEPHYVMPHHTEAQIRDLFGQQAMPVYLGVRQTIDVLSGTSLEGALIDLRRCESITFLDTPTEVVIHGRGEEYVHLEEVGAGHPEFALHTVDFAEMAGENAGSAAGMRVAVQSMPTLDGADLDSAIIDMTACAQPRYVLRGHSLLVTDADDQEIKYKDPNFGNAEFKVTADQVRKMSVALPPQYDARLGAVQVLPFTPPAPSQESILGRRV